jgi:hypothetical protein
MSAPIEPVAAYPVSIEVTPLAELVVPGDVAPDAPVTPTVIPADSIPADITADDDPAASAIDCAWIIAPLAVVPVGPTSASTLDGAIVPTEDVAATPETAVVTLADIAPSDMNDSHEPSEFCDACDDVTVPTAEVADCPARATVRLSAIEPGEIVAVVPARGFVEVIDPTELVIDDPTKASVFDAEIVPATDVEDVPASASVLDAEITPADDVPVKPMIAWTGTSVPAAPVADAPTMATVISLKALTAPSAVVADVPVNPTVIPGDWAPADKVADTDPAAMDAA